MRKEKKQKAAAPFEIYFKHSKCEEHFKIGSSSATADLLVTNKFKVAPGGSKKNKNPFTPQSWSPGPTGRMTDDCGLFI